MNAMKIMVGVKRVIDYNVRIQVKSDGSGVVTDGVKMSINPFDEIALEEALRLKEAGKAAEVIAVSVGPPQAQEQLRTALAMGADRGILVTTAEQPQPLAVAKIFAALYAKEQPGLVILGKQAIDDDAGQVPQMLAGLLDIAQATYASKLELEGESARVTREIDTGIEIIEISLPAVISADLRLNEPRYVKLPDIMKAKKKPIETIDAQALDVGRLTYLRVIKTSTPPARQGGRKVGSVEELVQELKQRGFV